MGSAILDGRFAFNSRGARRLEGETTRTFQSKVVGERAGTSVCID
jgi:hypothetical protein